MLKEVEERRLGLLMVTHNAELAKKSAPEQSIWQKSIKGGYLKMYVNIVLFDDFETLDAFGPAEVFGKLPEEFHIRYLSVSGDVINSVHGVKVWTRLSCTGGN